MSASTFPRQRAPRTPVAPINFDVTGSAGSLASCMTLGGVYDEFTVREDVGG